MNCDNFSICILPGGDETSAKELAAKIGITSVCFEKPETDDLFICFSGEGVSLYSGEMELSVDFSKILRRIPKNRIVSEMLVKSAKINGISNPSVIDATAGLGEDSFILASAGFSVKMFERDAIIAALLNDAVKKAEVTPELHETAKRLSLECADSIAAMNSGELSADVVLLDPMFPERQKSAQVKKKFQILHLLERPCTDERELLLAAVKCNPKKIVIKRPAKGPFLAGVKPAYSIGGKAVRYDVILPAQQKIKTETD